LHGDNDTVVPIETTIAMDEKLRALGVNSRMLTVKGASHAFILYGYKTEDAVVDTYMEPILTFLEELR
jgi:dipeptidyl aminopeptidase/acylaminoacyl peptidase